MEWTPSDEFVKQLLTPWPLLFLLVGGGLSFALATMLISFLRQRDYANALRASNRELDARIAELSKRDQQLSEFNEQLGESVQQRTAELARALREVETFNHSVSHDLRSPVGAILNFAAVLSEDYGSQLDPDGRRFLERISASAARGSASSVKCTSGSAPSRPAASAYARSASPCMSSSWLESRGVSLEV